MTSRDIPAGASRMAFLTTATLLVRPVGALVFRPCATRDRRLSNEVSVAAVLLDPAVVRRSVFLLVLMTAFSRMNDDTEDVHPTFLEATDHGGGGLSAHTPLVIAIVHDVGAVVGWLVFGGLSGRSGRRWQVSPGPPRRVRPADPTGGGRHGGYRFALAVTNVPVLIAVAALTALGPQDRGVSPGSQASSALADAPAH